MDICCRTWSYATWYTTANICTSVLICGSLWLRGWLLCVSLKICYDFCQIYLFKRSVITLIIAIPCWHTCISWDIQIHFLGWLKGSLSAFIVTVLSQNPQWFVLLSVICLGSLQNTTNTFSSFIPGSSDLYCVWERERQR